MVLILVLVVVVMVSLAGFSFVATMYNEDKATRLRGEELQAEQLVHSGAEAVRTVLALPASSRDGIRDLVDNPEMFRGVPVYDDQVNRQRGRFAVLAPRIDSREIVGPRFGLENESAKLDLGVLLQWERTQPGAGRDALLALPGMTDAVADAILDWIDTDDAPRGQGAESEFYETLAAPYAPRNGPAEGLEELLLIRGVTRRLLYGWDENRNYQVDAEELALEQAAEQCRRPTFRSVRFPGPRC